MNRKNKETFTLRIQFELAYEIILTSFLVIFVGLAFLFASNLLSVNWFSVIFGGTAILLFYLKLSSYLKIENDVLSVIYFKKFKYKEFQIITIDEFLFYERSRLVEVMSNGQVIGQIYITDKNKQILLDYLVKQYPKTPCILSNKIN